MKHFRYIVYFIIFTAVSLLDLNAGESHFYGSDVLSSRLITTTVQDADGYIWIGTEYGLNRFDGIQFKEYLNDENDRNSIMSNTVRSLLCDSKGRLWVGLLNGLQLYDPQKDCFSNVSFGSLGYTPSVSMISETSSGSLLIVVSRIGIFKVDPEKMAAVQINEITEICGTSSFNDVFEDTHGRLWISSQDKGLFCLDRGYVKQSQYNFGEKWETAGITRQNSLGVIIHAGQGKVWMFDEVHKRFIRARFDDGGELGIYDMLRSADGNFYIATDGHGILKINEEENCLEKADLKYPDGMDLTDASILSLMEDRNGSLWCGCTNRGLAMIASSNDEETFIFIESISGSATGDSHINDIYKDKEETLWCGTDDGYAIRTDLSGKTIRSYSIGSDITCFQEGTGGKIWIGTISHGLVELDVLSGKKTIVPELKGMRIEAMTRDNTGRLYLGTSGFGIMIYDPAVKTCTSLSELGPGNYKLLRNSYINKLLIDSRNRLWIGHYLGASCYDLGKESFLDIATDSLMNTSICYALAEKNDGSIWFGTSNGLYTWKEYEGRYDRYTTDQGLSSNMVCGLAEDNDGNIWCSTFRGLNCLDPVKGNITSYYAGNGVSKREYTRTCYFEDDGTIYFGDNKGITVFTPPLSHESRQNSLFVSGMNIGNRSVIPEKTHNIFLEHDENTITMEFSTLTFQGEGSIRLHYRMLGLDPEWYSTRNGVNQITYYQMRPGKYELEVYAEENGQISETSSWKITIMRPWYAGTAAVIIYSILVICLIIAIYMGYLRRIRERQNANKVKLYANMAHEVRTPMVMILNPLESIIKECREPDTLHAMKTMKRNALRVTRLLDQFLDIRKIDKGQLKLNRRRTDLVSHIGSSLSGFEYLAKKRNIRIEFRHVMDRMDFSIDPNHLDTIIYNLMSNALKFTPDKGEITVTLALDSNDGSAEICVMDTGTGIDEKEGKKLFQRFYQGKNSESNNIKGFGIGLNLCQMLVQMHGGTISASNRTDRSGAIFTVVIPHSEICMEEDTAAPDISAVEESVHEEIAEKKQRAKNSDRILLIDDDDEILHYMEDCLSGTYRILTAKDGDKGLQRALTDHPDLIISDVNMPGMDGFHMVRKIKNNPNTTHIPVILLTTRTETSDRIEGLDNGADAYLAKPFYLSELESTIDSLLKNRKRIQGKFSGSYQEDKIKSIEMKSDNEVLMERIMRVINENLDNPDLKVEKLSLEVGLSRAQLHRKMKEMTGISTGEFIRNIRLKKAAELLAERKVNISQITYIVGFSSHTHFSTAFRKFYGVSPTEYINNLGKSKSEK